MALAVASIGGEKNTMRTPLIILSIAALAGLAPAVLAIDGTDASSDGVTAAAARPDTLNDTNDALGDEASRPQFTPSEEKELARQAEMTGWRWDAAPSFYGRERAEAEIGRSRLRDLDVARFELHRHDDDDLLHRDLADDPEILDAVASEVLSSFLKLRREALEDVLGVDRWFGERRARRAERSSDDFATSYRLRLSPQVDVGSRNAVGVKVRMPHTRNHFFDHFSVKLRQDLDTGEMRYSLKFDDGDRFYFLNLEPSTLDEGDRYELGLRLWF